ncbi:Nitrate reductase [NADPH] [Fulvia fulva]|uniref:Nitrate reductase n=1 Tax=Passalora fulva TaxID=5499 RepID=A0A9Q8P5A4_PASFU|nr:Nitrate reductase [NADPH] [Fulvia fulva]KAK4631222.1 Nitrate reductase [NADPH] [Fulvia fulva]KAK4633848.1 Nitrate reductase [NADPH] [Fulvia fulva]UJO13562.1 Nitrate reductase [NADPH] [Fulvia fulva]WPV11510.1 Nitrate reductase [NADPH] [Fulvia fulva]WPV26331.1 Nitrate reductase [NADPH] [Fulvia fulva]
MNSSSTTEEDQKHLRRIVDLPPTPPDSDHSDVERSESPLSGELSNPDFPLPPSTEEPTAVLDQDKKTPDGWLPRDPRLIRLTGVHPFNVEAPLSDLYDQGFLTSPELFYVRNHGAVPQVKEEDIPDWEFSVEGMVANPFTLTLRELMEQYEQHTYPVTLVCAGNRRKEQNVVRKTKGFSWGAAGVSTALFTGVIMADVIRKAMPKRGARYVCMEGADKLPNGFYGTSVKLNWVLDENRGMMLAHGMNGELLRPDHGKPLRVVIPGQIGGRSVKWLKKLVVTAEPSDNWYHIYDNRVLPTMVSPEQSANEPKWWMDERYAIYDLSTNSAIAYPAHEEQLGLVGAQQNYRVKGYAYGGGGRRVTRVEISIDKGKSWRLANIDYAEDRYRDATPQKLLGGTLDFGWREASFCWCFWNIDVAVIELADSKDILVRAMDESMNLQPRDMYWSVLGMMNNPWYRISISKEGDYLRFEHPTQPALMPGGWMERVKAAGGDLSNGYWGEQIGGEDTDAPIAEAAAEVKMTKDDVKLKITIDDLRKHDNEDAPWFVVNGEVYDGTAFLKEHPGGAQSIVSSAGLDSTDEFMAIHSETAKAMMPSYHIGTLDEEGRAALTGQEVQPDENAEPTAAFLEPRAWKKGILHSKKRVSWDTRVFSVKLDHDAQTLGLPTGQHLMIRLRDPVTREAIIRSYTPISQTTKKGYMDILVKLYFDTDSKPGGKMSKALDAIPVGHYIDFKGPIGKFEYRGKGRCAVNNVERNIKKFYMICGGSGITPIYQVFRAVMQDKDDPTQCVVLDGNRLLEDILCKADLDQFAAENADRCKLLYTLTKAPEGWQGLQGRIAAPLLKEHADRSVHGDGEAMVLICGPEALEKSCHQALLELGWKDDELLFF